MYIYIYIYIYIVYRECIYVIDLINKLNKPRKAN